jgi:small subunit ribosomal protein S16
MLKIRLRRMGARHRPFYRVVVSDSRQVPTGAAIEEIGYYDPLQDPPKIEIKKDRVDHWVSQGAGLSSTVQNLLRRA